MGKRKGGINPLEVPTKWIWIFVLTLKTPQANGSNTWLSSQTASGNLLPEAPVSKSNWTEAATEAEEIVSLSQGGVNQT